MTAYPWSSDLRGLRIAVTVFCLGLALGILGLAAGRDFSLGFAVVVLAYIACVGFAYRVETQLRDAGYGDMPGWVVILTGVLLPGPVGMIIVLVVLGTANNITRGLDANRLTFVRTDTR